MKEDQINIHKDARMIVLNHLLDTTTVSLFSGEYDITELNISPDQIISVWSDVEGKVYLSYYTYDYDKGQETGN